MSRTSDIRTYIVSKFPLYTIDELTKVVSLISAIHSAQKGFNANGKTPGNITAHGLWFDYQENKLVSKEGIQFTTNSLDNFLEILQCMSGPMGLGERTFATLYLPVYSELKYACGGNETDMANIICGIFSGLIKRYQNRDRLGSNNDYNFKHRFIDDPRPVTITMKDIKFSDNDRAEFSIYASTEILSNALCGKHSVCLPTPRIASESIARTIKRKFINQPSPDTWSSFVAGIKKTCHLDDSDIRKLGDIIQSWFHTQEHSLTVCCDDNFINVTRVPSALSSIVLSVVVHQGSKSVIVGTHFDVVDFFGEKDNVECLKKPTKFVPPDYLFYCLPGNQAWSFDEVLDGKVKIISETSSLTNIASCFYSGSLMWRLFFIGSPFHPDTRWYYTKVVVGSCLFTSLYPTLCSDVFDVKEKAETIKLLADVVERDKARKPSFISRIMSFFK